MYYKLMHPYYSSDDEWDIENPIHVESRKWLPGIICPLCGTWASSKKSYRKILDKRIEEIINKPPLALEEWSKMEIIARQYIDINNNEKLLPGEIIGNPIIEVHNMISKDFLFAWTGEIIVTEKVVNQFVLNELSGVIFKKVQIMGFSDAIMLYLLIAKESKKVNTTNLQRCEICGRLLSPPNPILLPEEYNQEGYDVFSPEENPTTVFVSEKCRQIIKAQNYSNILLLA